LINGLVGLLIFVGLVGLIVAIVPLAEPYRRLILVIVAVIIVIVLLQFFGIVPNFNFR